MRLFLNLLLALLSAVVFGFATASFAATDEQPVAIVPHVCGCSVVEVYVDDAPTAWVSIPDNVYGVVPAGTDLFFDVTWACIRRDPLNDRATVDHPRSNALSGERCVVPAASL